MNWPLTIEERRELRRITHRCSDCGRRLPDHPELRDGREHRCFFCLWRWMHGTEPPGWRTAA
jgi:DNA-directed RNA polymerase subunit RPC12/RpoP